MSRGRQGVDWDWVSMREAARRTGQERNWCARHADRLLVRHPNWEYGAWKKVLVIFHRRRWYLAIRMPERAWHGRLDRSMGRVIFEYSPLERKP